MDAIDQNKNGLVDYTEFIAACMASKSYLRENHLRQAFIYFDGDRNGTISKDELRECLKSEDFTMTDEDIDNLIKGVDTNNDGNIDYEEFINMMNSVEDQKKESKEASETNEASEKLSESGSN